MKFLIKVPSDCLICLPADEAVNLLKHIAVVEESGYPRTIKETKDGLEIRTVSDDFMDGQSALELAHKTIAELRSKLEANSTKAVAVEAPL